jgi:hypothetical protein
MAGSGEADRTARDYHACGYSHIGGICIFLSLVKVIYGEAMKTIDVWYFLNQAKEDAVARGWSNESLVSLKLACDDLFSKVSDLSICPAWWMGGF